MTTLTNSEKQIKSVERELIFAVKYSTIKSKMTQKVEERHYAYPFLYPKSFFLDMVFWILLAVARKSIFRSIRYPSNLPPTSFPFPFPFPPPPPHLVVELRTGKMENGFVDQIAEDSTIITDIDDVTIIEKSTFCPECQSEATCSIYNPREGRRMGGEGAFRMGV